MGKTVPWSSSGTDRIRRAVDASHKPVSAFVPVRTICLPSAVNAASETRLTSIFVSNESFVASNTLTLRGKKLAAPPKAKLVLWQVRPPFRLSTWVTGLSIVETSVDPRGDLSVGGSMAGDARLVAYACSGAFKLKLVNPVEIADHKRYFGKGDLHALAEQAGLRMLTHTYFQLGFNNFATLVQKTSTN